MPAFITARVIAWIIAALGAAGVITAFAVHERSIEAAKVEAKIAAITEQAQKDRARELAQQHVRDVTYLQTILDRYDEMLKHANANAVDMAQRLHNYEVASRRGAAVPGTPATSAGPDAAAPQPSRVDRAIDGVVGSAGADAAQVIALQQYITKECH